ncbi:hypothetical protein T03_10326 [Trichinella britovi]|uniref:CCHC-type domain-containing protein n=1 Tax=Trichinella britovi TaxID=45882 RepID=A0A0V1CVL3_TRIBR|nr:hypothetical protein T03_10326 [Trichinella britovi]
MPQGVYSMTALGKDPRNGDLSVAEIMIATVRERPPNSVRIQWDKLTLEDSSLDLPAFLRFLQEQVQLSDAVRKTNYLRLEEKRSMSAVEKPRNSGQGSEAQKTVAFVVCRFCQKQHALSECSSLRHASRQKQREVETRYRLCFSCLKPGHFSSACKRRSGIFPAPPSRRKVTYRNQKDPVTLGYNDL